MIIHNSLELSFKFVVKLVGLEFLSLADVLKFVLKKDIELLMHVFHQSEGFVFAVIMVSDDSKEYIFHHGVELKLPDVRKVFRFLK